MLIKPADCTESRLGSVPPNRRFAKKRNNLESIWFAWESRAAFELASTRKVAIPSLFLFGFFFNLKPKNFLAFRLIAKL